MRVLQINTFGNLSTGRIATDIYHTLVENGYEGAIAYSRNSIAQNVPSFRFGNSASIYMDVLQTRLFGHTGFYSKKSTYDLIKKIELYNPDIIHLHNLHGYYVNVEILFSFLKRYGKPVVWTMHDCWPITGHCCHFAAAKCDKWKTGCYSCQLTHSYPFTYRDRSKKNYEEKKALFGSINDLYIVTVSKWLESVYRESFLSEQHIETIYNGIDLTVFKPIQSSFRKNNGLENKKIILSVASTWTVNKGLNDIIELSKYLAEEYQIVLVGLNNKQIRDLPCNIIGLERTNTISELVEIYSAADVVISTSVEETFGLTIVEAFACGTPAIVYNATALPELCTESTGIIVEPHDITGLRKAIVDTVNSPVQKDELLCRAEFFNRETQFQNYIALYEKIMRRNS